MSNNEELDKLSNLLGDITSLEHQIQIAIGQAMVDSIEPAFHILARDEEEAKWIQEYMNEYHPGLMTVVNISPLGPLFKTGMLTATPGVIDLRDQGLALEPLLRRHLQGDWGDLTEDDKKENEFSLKNGFRIFSSYETSHGKVWIITEADRSATTVLLPEEY